MAAALVVCGCKPKVENTPAVAEECTEQYCEDHECCKHECCDAKVDECVYCGACDCPMEINIAKINELYDKAIKAGKVTPEIQKEYDALQMHASDCIECGSCMEKCPKGVNIPERMKAAAKLFGK